MDATWKAALGSQLEAAIEMLDNAIVACPDELWSDRSRHPEYWYLVFHTLFFLDLYLSGSVEGFAPPAPFTLDELDPAGVLPEQPYTKNELRAYLEHGREKCGARIAALTDEQVGERVEYDWVTGNFAEFLLFTLRHVQHHTAQLNLILRQTTDSSPPWVARPRAPLR
jgi:DinB family protein